MFTGCDFKEETKTIAATTAAKPTHDTGMPEEAVEEWIMNLTGANNSIGGSAVDKYVGRINGNAYMDVDPSELRALLEYVYSRFGGSVPATSDLTWVLPFHLMSILTAGLLDGRLGRVGLPVSDKKSFMVELNANSSAGAWQIGWKKAQVEPDFMLHMVGQATGIAASQSDKSYYLRLPQFPCVGFIVDLVSATGITRLKLVRGQNQEIFDLEQADILSKLQPVHAVSLTDRVFIPLDEPTVFPDAGSRFVMDTGAGYAATKRIVPVLLVPLKSE